MDAALLYRRYGEQIFRYCLGRLRDREEAADAVQSTFLRVHVALEKGVVPRYEAAWLYKIAHNVCLSRVEASGRRARFETPRDLDDLDEAALAAPASEREALEGLADALAALPHNLRQAILLREWQGLSYAEIAAAMDTTVPAVETLLYRARRQLAASLERGGARVRGALAGLLDALGVRGLLSGAGAAKVAAGAALVALGGSGIGAAVALSGGSSSPPARPAAPRPQPAGVPAALFRQRPATSAPARAARPPRARTLAPAAAPVAPRGAAETTVATLVSASRPTVPTTGSQAPAAAPGTTAPAPAPTAPAGAPAATAAPATTAPAAAVPVTAPPAVTAPPLPSAPSVTTPTLPPSPAPPQVEPAATAPQLPVATPTLPVAPAVPAVTTLGG